MAAATTAAVASTGAPPPPGDGEPAGAQPLGEFTVVCYVIVGTTYSGEPTGPNVVAVDPKVIPLRTNLWIEGVGAFLREDELPRQIQEEIVDRLAGELLQALLQLRLGDQAPAEQGPLQRAALGALVLIGGAQILLDDPSGNPVELFQPGPRR